MHLGHGLLNQGDPQLLAFGLRVNQLFTFITWEEIVDDDSSPAPILAEPDLVDALVAVLAGAYDPLDKLCFLRDDGECTEQPAVAEDALGDVAGQWGPEDGPLDVVVPLRHDLVRPKPLRDPVVDQAGRFMLQGRSLLVVVETLLGGWEGIIDERLFIIPAVLDDFLPLGVRFIFFLCPNSVHIFSVAAGL